MRYLIAALFAVAFPGCHHQRAAFLAMQTSRWKFIRNCLVIGLVMTAAKLVIMMHTHAYKDNVYVDATRAVKYNIHYDPITNTYQIITSLYDRR